MSIVEQQGIRREYSFSPEAITRGTASALEKIGADQEGMDKIKKPFTELLNEIGQENN